MKPRYPPKVFRPFARIRTENDEPDILPTFNRFFPQERIEPKPLREPDNIYLKDSFQQDYRRRYYNQPGRVPRNKIELPKIEVPQVRPDLSDCKTPVSHKIPDNEFLDMKELTSSQVENPEVQDQKERQSILHKRMNSFRHWVQSESKRKSEKSPSPIVLASPLISRSNKYLKVCRTKAFSLSHKTEQFPLEMTFFPCKAPPKAPAQ